MVGGVGATPFPPQSANNQMGNAVNAGSLRRRENIILSIVPARLFYSLTRPSRRRQVWLDLEDTPAHTVAIRYEFRAQLVRLGILPPGPTPDPLQRRERAHGFEPGFSPDLPSLR